MSAVKSPQQVIIAKWFGIYAPGLMPMRGRRVYLYDRAIHIGQQPFNVDIDYDEGSVTVKNGQRGMEYVTRLLGGVPLQHFAAQDQWCPIRFIRMTNEAEKGSGRPEEVLLRPEDIDFSALTAQGYMDTRPWIVDFETKARLARQFLRPIFDGHYADRVGQRQFV